MNLDRYALLNVMFFKLADLDILIKNTMLSEKEKGGAQACLRLISLCSSEPGTGERVIRGALLAGAGSAAEPLSPEHSRAEAAWLQATEAVGHTGASTRLSFSQEYSLVP